MAEKIKLVKNRITNKRIKKLTEGLLGSLVDLTLFSLYLPLCSFGNPGNSRGVYKTFQEADETLSRFNYQNIKRSLAKLKEEGLIESIKSWVNEPIITQAGLKRLRAILSEYQVKRPWDGKLYLINYDVSHKQNYLRNRLRDFLKKLGAIQLQGSLYLMANNPYKFIQDFSRENNLNGLILVSELGKKGFIGEENLKDFIWKMTGLEKVNNHYFFFIEKWKNIKGKISKSQLAIEYYSILRGDPQLPFGILLDDYLGDEAYFLFRRLLEIP